MNPSVIFCLVYLPIQMIRSQQLNVEERPFEEQSDESEDELGSIDYNENFNRDRIDMDEEEELRRRWIGLNYISGLLNLKKHTFCFLSKVLYNSAGLVK